MFFIFNIGPINIAILDYIIHLFTIKPSPAIILKQMINFHARTGIIDPGAYARIMFVLEDFAIAVIEDFGLGI